MPVRLRPMNDRTRIAAFKKTGAIWRASPKKRKSAVSTVCQTLIGAYGRPRFGNPSDPLDDLIYIMLSNKTSPGSARAAYQRLRRRFRTWDDVSTAPIAALRSILKPAGLSKIKSKQIRAALRAIKNKFGACDLWPLKRFSVESAQNCLVALPGVSEKVAKCVMIYTLNFPVLPVDAHVHRIARRLGWTNRRRADQCHPELEALIPPSFRHGFHVGCIAHGRQICRPNNPLCDRCCVSRYCDFFKAAE